MTQSGHPASQTRVSFVRKHGLVQHASCALAAGKAHGDGNVELQRDGNKKPR
jgi:hypothetical protein